jgi:signal peptidase
LCLLAGTGVCCGLAAVTLSLHLGFRPVLTGSMRPTYGPGALLVTRPVPVSSVRPGMIVVFDPPGEHAEFAHRVATVSGPAAHPIITTKGDANPGPDPWHARLTSGSIPEVVVAVPWMGRLLVGLRGPLQLALIVFGGLAAAVAGSRWILLPTGRAATA